MTCLINIADCYCITIGIIVYIKPIAFITQYTYYAKLKKNGRQKKGTKLHRRHMCYQINYFNICKEENWCLSNL